MIFDISSTVQLRDNLFLDRTLSALSSPDSIQTQKAFSDKWESLSDSSSPDLVTLDSWKLFQLEWFLTLYGFSSSDDFTDFFLSLSSSVSAIDAGCGKGYKSYWLSSLSPNSSVLGIDFSSSVEKAASDYSSQGNLTFLRADISALPIPDHTVDFILCDQVLHHTPDPSKTLREFHRILKTGGYLLTYVYKKKALPRELFDQYFRDAVHGLSTSQLWEISRGMTDLGKLLSENDQELVFPDIPSLGIKGGPQSLQRFLYWNFFKCFWNSDFGYEASLSTNFDWYSPSIAFRYSKDEFLSLLSSTNFSLEYLHEEEACFSGRFIAQ